MNACNVSSQQETGRPGAERHRKDEMENAIFQMVPFCARQKYANLTRALFMSV